MAPQKTTATHWFVETQKGRSRDSSCKISSSLTSPWIRLQGRISFFFLSQIMFIRLNIKNQLMEARRQKHLQILTNIHRISATSHCTHTHTHKDITLSKQITDSREQSLSWESDSSSASLEIKYLKSPKIHYHNQCPPIVRVLQHINPAHGFQAVFDKIHLNIIYPSILGSSKWSLSSLKSWHGSLTEMVHGEEVLQLTDYFHFYTVQELRYKSKIANYSHPCLLFLDIQF